MIFAIKPITQSLFIRCNTQPEQKGILSNHTHSCISVCSENLINSEVWFSSFYCEQLNEETLKNLLIFVDDLERLAEKKMLIVQVELGLSKSIALCKFLLNYLNKHDRMINKLNFFDHDLFSWLMKQND